MLGGGDDGWALRDNDRTLVREAQRGSSQALADLYAAHWRRAHRAAYLVVRDEAAAEDIAQDAFLAAVAALDRFDRRRPFAPWLHRIVVNRAIDWGRREALRRKVDEPDEQAASAPPRADRRGRDGSPRRSSPSSSARWSSCATCSTTRRARSRACSSCRGGPSTRACGGRWIGSGRCSRRSDEASDDCASCCSTLRSRARTRPSAAACSSSPRPIAGRPRTRRSPAPRLALALASALALAALVLSPAGASVRDWVGDVFTAKAPPAGPALTEVPGGGRLLVQSEAGAWVVQPDGSRRLLGRYDEATWSPRGLFVGAAAGHTLSAVEPDGTVHWSLSAPGTVSDPRWSPSGFRIAYRSGESLRVVDADGSGDSLLDPRVAPVAPAWSPLGLHQLAFVDAGGRLRLLDADSRETLGSAGALPGCDDDRLGAVGLAVP